MQMRSALAAVCLGLLGWLGAPGPAAAADEGPSAKCLMCHDAAWQKMARSKHGVTADSRNFGCIGCHGGSAEHADNPEKKPDRRYGKGGMDAAESTETCLTCHQGMSTKTLVLWSGSSHPQNGVACTNCHQIHVEKDKVFNNAAQPTVCYACHKEQRILADRPWRHPIQEGKMSCSSCHAVHGSGGPKLVKRDTVNTTCYTCHAEKRGPFVQNHQPVQEDCGSCHNPHGSNIQAMLKARDPILCNQCHVPHTAGSVGALRGQPGVLPPAVPPQTVSAVTPLSSGINTINIWQGRSCLNCHTQVHGSNNPAARQPAPANLFR